MMDREEAAYQAEVLYLVAELLRYPAGQLVQSAALLGNLFTEESDEYALLAAMQDSAASSLDEKLQVDYTSLLIGSMRMLAVPYASYYLDGHHQLGGPSTVAVARQYARYGLALANEPKQPADHLATMLEFASVLLRRSLACPQDQAGCAKANALQDEARAFYGTYIAGWIEEFAACLGANAQTAFYRCLADLLPLVLLEDSFLLEQLEALEEKGSECPCSALCAR